MSMPLTLNRSDPAVAGRSCQRCGAPGHWCAGRHDEYVMCYKCAETWCAIPEPFTWYSFSEDKWASRIEAFIGHPIRALNFYAKIGGKI